VQKIERKDKKKRTHFHRKKKKGNQQTECKIQVEEIAIYCKPHLVVFFKICLSSSMLSQVCPATFFEEYFTSLTYPSVQEHLNWVHD